MKLKSLHIDSYRHLQNINFEFTYPEGHLKFGQPLEKICIIGQSATGKTSILELIKDNFSTLSYLRSVKKKFLADPYKLNFSGNITYLCKDGLLEMNNESIIKNENKYIEGFEDGEINYLLNELLILIYFGSEIISKETIKLFNKNPIDILNGLSLENYSRLQANNRGINFIYEFGQNVNEEVWFSVLYKLLHYRKRFTQMASEIINKGAIADPNKLSKEYKKWSENNPNPLIKFAEKFNPLLNKLNLEIDLVNTEFTIPIKSKIKDEVIPVSGLSTGTKGLLLSMFPLYELDTKDALVLIDEPERSLFPDMQIDLMQHYQNLAPEAQIIVATHSPFIAASFDPEERFILYFDTKGEVAVRKGESPKGDDPNDMLRNDFNVDYFNEFGKQAYQKYLSLKMTAKQETEPEKKKGLIMELTALGDKYNF